MEIQYNRKVKCPRLDWKESLANYPLENFPDYEPGKPPRFEKLAEISHLDEYQKIWGKPCGEQGIGRLREVALVRPDEYEMDPLFLNNPEFFLMRYMMLNNAKINLERMQQNFDQYVDVLKQEGVKVDIVEHDRDSKMGVYGPMRKLFVAARLGFVINGGAIIKRWGHSSWSRGLEYYAQRFFTQLDVPILLFVSGKGIFEDAWVWAAENVLIGNYGIACNEEAMDQLTPVFNAAGIEEVVMGNSTSIMDSFQSGGDFHTDVSLGIADLGLAVVYPAQLDWKIYTWLKGHGFKLLEISQDEQMKCLPANGVLLRPGKIIMSSFAKKTNAMLRKEGVDVIEIDTDGLAHGGVNGIRCCTCRIYREPGPRIEEIKG
jgi:N-dimethylarginine dimethylaminohydrolase